MSEQKPRAFGGEAAAGVMVAHTTEGRVLLRLGGGDSPFPAELLHPITDREMSPDDADKVIHALKTSAAEARMVLASAEQEARRAHEGRVRQVMSHIPGEVTPALAWATAEAILAAFDMTLKGGGETS